MVEWWDGTAGGHGGVGMDVMEEVMVEVVGVEWWDGTAGGGGGVGRL